MEVPAGTATGRAEAERLLGIAEKLLQNRDLAGSREFAILAQETEPLLDGSDQILAVVDVLLASENRIHNHHDWYSILQIDRKSDDIDAVKKQYRRLALLLHPDKNKFPLADTAFRFVADAWAVLSDSSKKSSYDNELSFFFTKVDLVPNKINRNQGSAHNLNQNQRNMQQQQQVKVPARKTAEEKNKQKGAKSSVNDSSTTPLSFWTACPYCYILYEYPRVYNECCLRCENCQRAFHAASIPDLPPLVPGKESYYCCWGFFPLGFSSANDSNSNGNGNGNGNGNAAAAKLPTWMPPVFSQPESNGKPTNVAADVDVDVNVEFDGMVDGNGPVLNSNSGKKKRGRPRKFDG